MLYPFPRRPPALPAYASVMRTPWYIKARQHAKALGLSYQAMADRLGVSKPTVGHWMTGRHYPPLPKLREIAQMLETSVADLVAEDERVAVTDTEWAAIRAIREMPAEYRPQAVAMVRAFLASLPPDTPPPEK